MKYLAFHDTITYICETYKSIINTLIFPDKDGSKINRYATHQSRLLVTIILSIVTLGIYQWYLVYAFARETNIACRRDGQNTTGLFLFIILTIITFGIYSIVWYCKWISRCNTYLAVNGQPQGLQVSTYLLSIFFGWLTLGIFNLVVFCKMLYLQNAVNNTYNNITGCTSEAPAGYAPAAV